MGRKMVLKCRNILPNAKLHFWENVATQTDPLSLLPSVEKIHEMMVVSFILFRRKEHAYSNELPGILRLNTR